MEREEFRLAILKDSDIPTRTARGRSHVRWSQFWINCDILHRHIGVCRMSKANRNSESRGRVTQERLLTADTGCRVRGQISPRSAASDAGRYLPILFRGCGEAARAGEQVTKTNKNNGVNDARNDRGGERTDP